MLARKFLSLVYCFYMSFYIWFLQFNIRITHKEHCRITQTKFCFPDVLNSYVVFILAKYPHDSHSKNAYLRKVLQQKYAPLWHMHKLFWCYSLSTYLAMLLILSYFFSSCASCTVFKYLLMCDLYTAWYLHYSLGNYFIWSVIL